MYLKVEISRHLVILLFVLINILASPGDGLDLDLNLKLEDGILFSQFYDFATKHGRQYLYNSTELLSRFKVFKVFSFHRNIFIYTCKCTNVACKSNSQGIYHLFTVNII